MASAVATGPPKPIGTNGVVIAGFAVLFSAQLSGSFAMFTIQRAFDGHSLDVVVRTADGLSSERVQTIMKEVQRCQEASLPIRVKGWMPFEHCSCTDSCPYRCMHAWNVNELPVVRPVYPLCRAIEQSPPILPAAFSRASPLNQNVKSKTGTTRKRVNQNNYHRSSKFVEWLVESCFGPKVLGATAVGVLDVAGGSGGVTFELSLRRGIPSTVIDPRPVKINTKQRNTLNFRKKSRALLQPGVDISHLAQVMLDRYRDWHPSQLQCLFDQEFANTQKGDEMLRNCTCIVGMHPDEATDFIIEMAIKYKKPFAVCPCCVFPNLFTKRRLPDDRPVRTYDDLCAYIVNCADNVQQIELDFEGRNRVFFWVPPEE